MKLTLQTSHNRSEFFAKDLGCFGVPLSEALSPKLPVKVTFEGQTFAMGSAMPSEEEAVDPFEDGFSSPRCWAEGCLGWIWCQWLSGTPKDKIQKEVEFVVSRGMEMQKKSKNQNYRCLHDLWLLNCAIFASSSKQLESLADAVVDSRGDKQEPRNNGELFAAAWCGTLKHWILGDLKKALKQFETTRSTYRYDIARFAPKTLISKWLAQDWKGFVIEQQKDFKALWDRIRKCRFAVSGSENETVVAFDRLGVPGTGWCWSHCGLAMLAHRQGVEVATDAFWFPPHALQCVDINISKK